jgi:hypothetical protein
MPGCKPILTVEFAPLIGVVLYNNVQQKQKIALFLGEKTRLSAADLLTIFEFFFEPIFFNDRPLSSSGK